MVYYKIIKLELKSCKFDILLSLIYNMNFNQLKQLLIGMVYVKTSKIKDIKHKYGENDDKKDENEDEDLMNEINKELFKFDINLDENNKENDNENNKNYSEAEPTPG